MSESVFALDPGSSETGWVFVDPDGRVELSGTTPNDQLLSQLRVGLVLATDGVGYHGAFDGLTPANRERVTVIEWTAPRGMPASIELFETMWWAGRFTEALAGRGFRVERLARLKVKRAVCGSAAAKDSNVRQALIDRYGGAGGKEAAIGRKATPGPLYGVSGDAWAALAVAVAWQDGAR